MSKVCTLCKINKPLDDYYNKFSRCKICIANYQKEYYKRKQAEKQYNDYLIVKKSRADRAHNYRAKRLLKDKIFIEYKKTQIR
jgi:hypothetical protein